MDEIAGRLEAIGWLILNHLQGISRVTTDPTKDTVSLDLEIMILWAISNAKIRDNKRFKENWPKFQDRLQKVQDKARSQPVVISTAERLEIRVEQLECIVTAAVEEGQLAIADLPMDDQTARGRKNGMVKHA